MQKLTPEIVQKIFFDCLFTDDEMKGINPDQAPPGAIIVLGLTMKYGLSKIRLDKHKEEIKELLSQLRDGFFHDKGGGMSFLNLPLLNDGTLWGDYPAAHQLMLLGLASAFIEYCAPKSLWSAFPGGSPYIVINLDGF